MSKDKVKNREGKTFFLKSDNSGFTLLEILIAISIIILMTGLVMTNYHSSQKELALQRAAYKFSQDVRRAAEMAMAAKQISGSFPDGYGLYLDQSWGSYYKLYADENGDERYNGSDTELETIYLEHGIIIKNANPAVFSVNFRPPAPIVKLKDGGGGNKDWVEVTFSLESDPSKTKVIRINGIGMVEIQ